jgi:hypothetical protein
MKTETKQMKIRIALSYPTNLYRDVEGYWHQNGYSVTRVDFAGTIEEAKKEAQRLVEEKADLYREHAGEFATSYRVHIGAYLTRQYRDGWRQIGRWRYAVSVDCLHSLDVGRPMVEHGHPGQLSPAKSIGGNP